MARKRSRYFDMMKSNPEARSTYDAFGRAMRRDIADGLDVRCHLCRQPIRPGVTYPDPWSYSTDHVRPYRDDDPATWDRTNLAPAHRRCNRLKSRTQWADPTRGMGQGPRLPEPMASRW